MKEISFSQTTVSERFLHGHFENRLLLDVAKDLQQGRISAEQLPLAVVRHKEQHFTLNNRASGEDSSRLPSRKRTWKLRIAHFERKIV